MRTAAGGSASASRVGDGMAVAVGTTVGTSDGEAVAGEGDADADRPVPGSIDGGAADVVTETQPAATMAARRRASRGRPASGRMRRCHGITGSDGTPLPPRPGCGAVALRWIRRNLPAGPGRPVTAPRYTQATMTSPAPGPATGVASRKAAVAAGDGREVRGKRRRPQAAEDVSPGGHAAHPRPGRAGASRSLSAGRSGDRRGGLRVRPAGPRGPAARQRGALCHPPAGGRAHPRRARPRSRSRSPPRSCTTSPRTPSTRSPTSRHASGRMSAGS